MKISSVIVDDEINSREVLKTLLGKFCPEVNVLGESSNVENAYKMILERKPDLVFLDVQMPFNDGFSLLQKFNPIPFSVIFITSYDQYAIHAIKFSALDYLMKPVEINELTQAVAKAISKKEEMNRYIIHLLNNIEENNLDKKIPVHSQGKVKFIKTSSIHYIEAKGSYSTLHGEDGKYTSCRSLKDFEDFLVHNLDFIRINKSILVNSAYIQEYSKGDLFTLTLTSGITFESSRRRKPEILERLKEKKANLSRI